MQQLVTKIVEWVEGLADWDKWSVYTGLIFVLIFCLIFIVDILTIGSLYVTN